MKRGFRGERALGGESSRPATKFMILDVDSEWGVLDGPDGLGLSGLRDLDGRPPETAAPPSALSRDCCHTCGAAR